jgi:hypothetical protein
VTKGLGDSETALKKVPESCSFGNLKRHHAFSSNF